MEANDGAYVGVDAKGYQILANYRGPGGRFLTVSIRDVLAGKVPADVFRDRIVLIGSTAVSIKDFLDTPYTGSSALSAVNQCMPLRFTPILSVSFLVWP